MSSRGRPIVGRAIAMLLLLGTAFTFVSPPPATAQSAQVAEPQITAQAAILIDFPGGHILYDKNMHERMAPASTTKILTALLALQYGNLDDIVTAQARDLVPGTSMGLHAGEKQTLRNLLYGLLLPSGNDAAMTIARYIGSKPNLPVRSAITDPVARFVALMNQKAISLKLTDSHFANPHGLDAAGHFTSAYDLVCFTYLALQNPTFAAMVKQPNFDVPGHSLHNLNKMLALYPGTIGVKTGYTGKAGLCLVTAAQRDGHTVIAVVLDAPKWTDDATSLLNYGFARLSTTANAATPAATRLAQPTPKATPRLSHSRLTPTPSPRTAPAHRLSTTWTSAPLTEEENRKAVNSLQRSLSTYGLELSVSRQSWAAV